MIKRSRCLFNNEYIGIEYFYTVHDGKQINIPGRIEEYRKYGRENKLFCACGCGRNVVIYAGEKMLRAQHFKLKANQIGVFKECREYEENEITVYSKMVLKLWLDDIFKLQPGDVRINVPINNIFDVKRKYEFTHYVEKYNLGLCYERDDANLNDDKIKVISNSTNRFLYITDISNGGIKDQYPEFMMKIQRLQNYCILLNIHGKSEYYNTDVKIVRYEKNHKNLWEELCVVSGKLSEFKISEEGILFYGDDRVLDLVNSCVDSFYKKKEELEQEVQRKIQEALELKAKLEAERLTREEEARKQREEEQRRQKELEEQKRRQREAQELENQKRLDELLRKKSKTFFDNHPKIKKLMNYIVKLDEINGFFYSKTFDSHANRRDETIYISSVMYDIYHNSIRIKDKSNKDYYIFVSDNSEMVVGECITGTPYLQMDLSKYSEEEIIFEFRKRCTCREKNKEYEIFCAAPEMDCPHKGEDGMCNMPISACSYRKWE